MRADLTALAGAHLRLRERRRFRACHRVPGWGLPESRGVTNAGTIRLKKRLLFLSNAALQQHPVGLEVVDDEIWSIHFCRVLPGRVDERDYVIRAQQRTFTHVAGLFCYLASRLLTCTHGRFGADSFPRVAYRILSRKSARIADGSEAVAGDSSTYSFLIGPFLK